MRGFKIACAVLGLSLLSMLRATPPEQMQIFLLIGQSNMAGRGIVEPQDTVPHPRVWMLNKELAWVPAIDPVHFDKPERAGVGLASTFARVVVEKQPEANIGLVPAAFGGTSLEEWKPGSPLYTNAVSRAREALKHGRLAGILWHQGENDAAPGLAATYPERFAAMISQLRSDLDANEVPVVVGEIGHFVENNSAINAAIAKVPSVVPKCGFVSSAGLTDKGDKLHFDSASFRELGRRYERAWEELAK